MITYRLQTQPPTSQPPAVKFYRTIAISFLAVTIVLLGVVVFITSQKADIVIVAREDNKKVNLTVVVSNATIPNTITIAGNVTTTVFNFSTSFSPTGNKTSDATATGEVIIYNKSSEEFNLVKTTRLLNQDNILFRLADRVYVPPSGQVRAQVYADKIGAGGNIGPSHFTIPGLSPDKQKIVYAESTSPMIGGVKQIGILTQSDVDTAEIDYKEKVKQAFLDTLNATDQQQTIVDVKPGELQCDKKIGDEVNGFKISGTNMVTMVTYNQDQLADIINQQINNKIDTTFEKVLSVNNNPQITVSSSDTTKGTAELNVEQNVIVTIDANSEKLSPQFFAGKNKDDAKKYLLGLDHVSAATVQLTPGWTNTVPGSPDKIKVVVKNVQ